MSIYIEPGDIIIYHGTDFKEIWRIPWGIAGCSYKGIIREEDAAFAKVDELEIIPDAEKNEILITLSAADSAILNPEFRYTYAIEQVDSLGFKTPLMQGRIIVLPWESYEP